MTRESYGYIGSWDSLGNFFFESEMTKHLLDKVEIPSLINALDQEKVLKIMANQNYKFQLWIERNSPHALGSDVIYVELVIEDDLTKTEFELIK